MRLGIGASCQGWTSGKQGARAPFTGLLPTDERLRVIHPLGQGDLGLQLLLAERLGAQTCLQGLCRLQRGQARRGPQQVRASNARFLRRLIIVDRLAEWLEVYKNTNAYSKKRAKQGQNPPLCPFTVGTGLPVGSVDYLFL